MSVPVYCARMLAASAWLLLAQPLQAQELSDPTRPPAEAMLAQGAAPPAPSAPKRPQLQSVLVGKGQGGREVAVIDGQVVRRGEKVNGAVLVSVSAGEAVLRRGQHTEVLKLLTVPAPAPARN